MVVMVVFAGHFAFWADNIGANCCRVAFFVAVAAYFFEPIFNIATIQYTVHIVFGLAVSSIGCDGSRIIAVSALIVSVWAVR